MRENIHKLIWNPARSDSRHSVPPEMRSPSHSGNSIPVNLLLAPCVAIARSESAASPRQIWKCDRGAKLKDSQIAQTRWETFLLEHRLSSSGWFFLLVYPTKHPGEMPDNPGLSDYFIRDLHRSVDSFCWYAPVVRRSFSTCARWDLTISQLLLNNRWGEFVRFWDGLTFEANWESDKRLHLIEVWRQIDPRKSVTGSVVRSEGGSSILQATKRCQWRHKFVNISIMTAQAGL